MKMLKILLCSIALMIGGFAATGQTADELIAKYETAMGGKEKMASLQSVYLEGVSIMGNGNELTTHITKVNKQLLRTEVSFGGMGNFKMLVTDKAGWASNPRNGGKFEPIPEEGLKAMQSELDLSGNISNYAAKGNKVELLGKDTVNGISCYKLKLSLPTGSDITYYLDPTTYYIVREQRKGTGMMGRRPGGQPPPGDNIITTDYADFQKTPEGYIFPYSIKRVGMGGNMIIEKLEVNQRVDPKLFKPE